MIRHRPADDLAAVEVHDRGQIKPALISLDVGDVGQPDPVRRGGAEIALEQVRGDREVVTAVGSAHPSWPRHDGPGGASIPQCGRDSPRGPEPSTRHGRGGYHSGHWYRGEPA